MGEDDDVLLKGVIRVHKVGAYVENMEVEKYVLLMVVRADLSAVGFVIRYDNNELEMSNFLTFL